MNQQFGKIRQSVRSCWFSITIQRIFRYTAKPIYTLIWIIKSNGVFSSLCPKKCCNGHIFQITINFQPKTLILLTTMKPKQNPKYVPTRFTSITVSGLLCNGVWICAVCDYQRPSNRRRFPITTTALGLISDVVDYRRESFIRKNAAGHRTGSKFCNLPFYAFCYKH